MVTVKTFDSRGKLEKYLNELHQSKYGGLDLSGLIITHAVDGGYDTYTVIHH